jgi:peroxiredoxin
MPEVPSEPGRGATSNHLNAVSVLASGEAWAVGFARSGDRSQPLILHYKSSPCPTPSLPAVATPDPTVLSTLTQVPPTFPPPPGVGDVAPDFTLPNVRGGEVTLSELRGRPLVLTFWGGMCRGCDTPDIGELQQVYEAYSPQIEIVGISTYSPENAQVVREFIDGRAYTWLFAHDINFSTASAYGVLEMPTLYFIDASGVIRAVHAGAISREQIEDYLKLLW